jgi:ATP-dependent helicase/nuclease subunit A
MDAENFRKIPSPISKAIDAYLKKKRISEEMRLLYVAMTRAKEKLILVGSAEENTLVEQISRGVSFKDAVEPEKVKKASSMLDFVLLGCAKLEDFNTDNYTKDGITPNKVKNDIKFTFKRRSFEDFVDEEEEVKEEPEIQATENPEVNRRLEYEYDFGSRYYTKYSVSDLKKLECEEINPYFEKLSPLFEEEMSGAERGTSIHKIFEEIDAKKVTDIESIKEYTKEIPAEEIYGFYVSEIGERLKKSNEIYKEEPFIISETKDGSEILIQGVIDCYFKDNDKYVIVDFKSDTLTPSNREARIDMYKIQLEYYKKAVKKMHNTENVESYLYFTKTKETIEV